MPSRAAFTASLRRMMVSRSLTLTSNYRAAKPIVVSVSRYVLPDLSIDRQKNRAEKPATLTA